MPTETNPTAIRTENKVTVTFPDGTTQTVGGKLAAKATHVVIALDGAWGVLAKCSRPDLASKETDKARNISGPFGFERVECLEVEG